MTKLDEMAEAHARFLLRERIERALYHLCIVGSSIEGRENCAEKLADAIHEHVADAMGFEVERRT